MTVTWIPATSVTEALLWNLADLAARELFDPPRTDVALRRERLLPLFRRRFMDQENGLAVVMEGEKVVAFASVIVEKLPPGLHPSKEALPRVCYLTVEPQVRKQGLGSQLLQHCEAWARQKGHQQMSLYVPTEKTTLQKWYSKLGYARVSEIVESLPPIDISCTFTLRMKSFTKPSLEA